MRERLADGELEPIDGAVLVVDEAGRPLDWVEVERLSADGALRAGPGRLEPVIDRLTTLRDALSALLEAGATHGAVVDGEGRLVGLIGIGEIAAGFRREPQTVGSRGADAIDWDWVDRHGDDIRTAVVQHVELVLIAVAIAVVISVPVAILVRGHRIPYGVVLVVGSVLYTIPSLALFAFLVPSLGIGRDPVIVALVIYSFLILVRNTVVGLEGVPPSVLEAARGMGLTRWQILTRVELPLALPSIVSGIRDRHGQRGGHRHDRDLVAAGGLGDLIYTDGISPRFF